MDIVELLSLYLSGEGYRILSAVDGQQGLTLMETQKVDLAILDIMMPGMNGYDLLREIRKHWFSAQLEVAKKTGLPVIIHSRDAAKDTLDIMKVEHNGATGGVIHCFSYGVEMAREYLNMGYYIGIGGVLTFKNAKKLIEVAEYAPLDRIVLETDCPYLAPVPNRGKRNFSGNLPYVVEKLAEIKGVSKEEIIRETAKNARALYRITE